jgi:hypothetical protein
MKKIISSAIALLIAAIGVHSQVILQDSFNYADGLTTFVSTNIPTPILGWTNHSGTVDSRIKSGRLEVFGNRAGDINRQFTNTPAGVVYASFTVNSTNLINGTNYFAHFIQNFSTFRARVFAAGLGVAPNTWRLGIAGNAGTASKIYPLDLQTNVDYRVVIAWDNASAFTATMWVDPVVSTDLSVVSSDVTSAITLVGFGFRQSGTTVSAPNLTVDDLYCGNSFADVAVAAPKPAVIYAKPAAGPTTIFTGNNGSLSCVGGGAGTVTFQWQHAGTNLVDDANYVGSTSNVLSLVSAVVPQTGNYKCIVSSITNGVLFNSVTSTVAAVVVSAAPVPPTFTSQPVSQTVYRGQTVTFSTTVNSPGNVSYLWYSNNVALPSETASTLTIPASSVVTNITGSTFKVAVTNDVVTQGIVSTNAVLTVNNPAHVSIAFLRSLVDPNNNYAATNTTTPYEITGVVTTYTNLTTGNTSSYYLQDATAGINIFATFGSTFRPLQGDVVTFVGVTSSFSSGLELFADTVGRPYTSYSVVSNNFALPTPLSIPFTVTNNNFSNMNYTIAGKLVQLTNVFFGANAGAAIAGGFVAVTNGLGQSFNLWFSTVDLDTQGQILPAYATSVTGVMFGSMNGGSPNFAVAVTKFSDIVTPPAAPPTLGVSQSGSMLTFSWSDAAYNLQSQTNTLGGGLDTNNASWFDYPDPSNPVNITVDPANPTVFFRLVKP